MKRSRCSEAVGLAGAGIDAGRRQTAAACLLFALTAMAAPSGALAQAEPGEPPTEPGAPSSECCLVLLLPVGAKAVAVGQTMAARGSPDAAFANPAGLAVLDDNHLVVHHSSTVAGEANAVSLLWTPDVVGTIGLSYQLYDYGEIETTDNNGAPTGVLSLRDHVLTGSFATSVYEALSAGFNLKFYQLHIDCRGDCIDNEVAASTQALDAGVHFRPTWLPYLQIGAAITNVGFALQVVNAPQSDPAPTRTRVGVAYEVLHHAAAAEGTQMWLAIEVVDRWQVGDAPQLSAGVEFSAAETIFLRAGWVPGEGLDSGTAVGVGVRRERIDIAVSKSLTGSALDPENEPFQVSFGLRF